MGQRQRIANMAKARVVLSGGAIAYRGGENGRWFGSYACSLRITDRGGNARNFYNASTNTLFELEWYKTV